MEVNHKDSNRLNPEAANLEYVTRSENNLHAVKNGRWVVSRGETKSNAKLTEQDVRDIRASSEVSRVVAQRYGLCHKTVNLIRSRKKWAHVA